MNRRHQQLSEEISEADHEIAELAHPLPPTGSAGRGHGRRYSTVFEVAALI